MNKKREDFTEMIKILVYVLFSIGGLLLLKIGASSNFSINISKGVIDFKVNGYLLAGMCLYVLSFITSLIIMRSTDLSFFYPISSGLGYVGICVLSYYILNENISIRQLLGIGLILAGVIVMNLKTGKNIG